MVEAMVAPLICLPYVVNQIEKDQYTPIEQSVH